MLRVKAFSASNSDFDDVKLNVFATATIVESECERSDMKKSNMRQAKIGAKNDNSRIPTRVKKTKKTEADSNSKRKDDRVPPMRKLHALACGPSRSDTCLSSCGVGVREDCGRAPVDDKKELDELRDYRSLRDDLDILISAELTDCFPSDLWRGRGVADDKTAGGDSKYVFARGRGMGALDRNEMSALALGFFL